MSSPRDSSRPCYASNDLLHDEQEALAQMFVETKRYMEEAGKRPREADKVELYSGAIQRLEYLNSVYPSFCHVAVRNTLAEAYFQRACNNELTDDLLSAVHDFRRAQEVSPSFVRVESRIETCVSKLREKGVKAVFSDKLKTNHSYKRPSAKKPDSGDEEKKPQAPAAKSDSDVMRSEGSAFSHWKHASQHLGYGDDSESDADKKISSKK